MEKSGNLMRQKQIPRLFTQNVILKKAKNVSNIGNHIISGKDRDKAIPHIEIIVAVEVYKIESFSS